MYHISVAIAFNVATGKTGAQVRKNFEILEMQGLRTGRYRDTIQYA